jgi:hypothetical protein
LRERGRGQRQEGEVAQTMYAHMNKRINNKKEKQQQKQNKRKDSTKNILHLTNTCGK